MIDLHSGGTSLHVRRRQHDGPGAARRRGRAAHVTGLLKAFGLPRAFLYQPNPVNVTAAARRQNAICFLTELGGGGNVDPRSWRRGARCLALAAATWGCLTGGLVPEPPAPPRLMQIDRKQHYVYALDDGVYEPLVALGDRVKRASPRRCCTSAQPEARAPRRCCSTRMARSSANAPWPWCAVATACSRWPASGARACSAARRSAPPPPSKARVSRWRRRPTRGCLGHRQVQAQHGFPGPRAQRERAAQRGGAHAHVRQAPAAGLCVGVEAAAVVAQVDLDALADALAVALAFSATGHQPRNQAGPRRRRVRHHVGERLEQQHLHLVGLARAPACHRRQMADVPVQVDALGQQPRPQPVAHRCPARRPRRPRQPCMASTVSLSWSTASRRCSATSLARRARLLGHAQHAHELAAQGHRAGPA
jgi:hypothetical protein